MDLLDVCLAGGSLVVSLAVLVLVWSGLRSTRRVEQAGEERLEMLREQQVRLQYLREERCGLEDELEWRRSMGHVQERPLESEASSKPNGHADPK